MILRHTGHAATIQKSWPMVSADDVRRMSTTGVMFARRRSQWRPSRFATALAFVAPEPKTGIAAWFHLVPLLAF
jgi:hypothetical protein